MKYALSLIGLKLIQNVSLDVKPSHKNFSVILSPSPTPNDMTVNRQNSKIHTFKPKGSKILKFSHKIVSERVPIGENFKKKCFAYVGGGGVKGFKNFKIRKKNSGRTPCRIFYLKVGLTFRYNIFFQTPKKGDATWSKKQQNLGKDVFFDFFFYNIYSFHDQYFEIKIKFCEISTFWNKAELLFLITGPQKDDDSIAALLNFDYGSTPTAYSTFSQKRRDAITICLRPHN